MAAAIKRFFDFLGLIGLIAIKGLAIISYQRLSNLIKAGKSPTSQF